jgi:hypothetical protein
MRVFGQKFFVPANGNIAGMARSYMNQFGGSNSGNEFA